jgi:hypothetical protein
MKLLAAALVRALVAPQAPPMPLVFTATSSNHPTGRY